MSNEPREERQSIEGIPIPVYFDRYVTAEFRALEGQILGLQKEMNFRFEGVNQQFEAIEEQFIGLQKEMNLRFEAVNQRFEVMLQKEMNLRFEAVNQRFEAIIKDLKKDIDLCLTEARFNEFRKSVDMRFADMERRFVDMEHRFDRLEGSLKWSIGLLAPVLAGILAIIVKQFLG